MLFNMNWDNPFDNPFKFNYYYNIHLADNNDTYCEYHKIINQCKFSKPVISFFRHKVYDFAKGYFQYWAYPNNLDLNKYYLICG